MAAVGRLLDRFNAEFTEPTPGPEVLDQRVADLVAGGDTEVLVAGDGPDGLVVLRFRRAIWTPGLECYLAELYVVPEVRGHGVGRALLAAALEAARRRGADTMDIGVDAGDVAARRLYESMGFTNRVGGDGEEVIFVYERDL
jgi:ribosomal protein S18 acetylase RimI-like enzyme